VTKLLVTTTNDTLCDKTRVVKLPQIKFPVPCLSMAILPKVKGEEDKIVTGLHKLQDEDPVFTVRNDPETHQIVVSGLGEQQIDVLRSKLSSKFHVESSLEEPRVPYRETIRKKSKSRASTRSSPVAMASTAMSGSSSNPDRLKP